MQDTCLAIVSKLGERLTQRGVVCLYLKTYISSSLTFLSMEFAISHGCLKSTNIEAKVRVIQDG